MNYLFLHDVADKVGNPGVIGAIAAGLATFALLAGVAKIRRKDLPKDFPDDPEARQAKYSLAFNQMQAASDKAQGTENLLAALKNNPAALLSLTAFDQFQKSAHLKKGE